MTEKRYKFDTIRLINLWLLPTFFTALIIVLFYSKFDKFSQPKLIDIIAWSLLFVFAVGLFIFLFFNHISFARQTELVFFDKQLQLFQGDKSSAIDFKDIKEIIEYSSKKLPWGHIMKWKIVTTDKEFVVSSLTISQFYFEKYFWGKIKHKVSLLPTI